MAVVGECPLDDDRWTGSRCCGTISVSDKVLTRQTDIMNTHLTDIENRLWSAADELRANSRLKASEYSTPVLGLIFLRYADHKFAQTEQEISSETATSTRRRMDPKTPYQARGAFYLPEKARFQYLLSLPESENIGQAVTDAMKAIEAENSHIEGVLPKTYNRLEKSTLLELLRIMEQIPMDIEGDAFGKVYEYFLGNFAHERGATRRGVLYANLACETHR